jgi:hypothetical protein
MVFLNDEQSNSDLFQGRNLQMFCFEKTRYFSMENDIVFVSMLQKLPLVMKNG